MEDQGADRNYFSRRTFLIGAAMGIGGVALAACNGIDQASSTTGGSGSAGDARNATIGLIVGEKADPFYVTMAKGAQARAAARGVNLLFDGPVHFDPAEQIPIVNAMIKKKIKALLIAACDTNALIEPLKNADNAGIKVISVDTFIGDGDYANGTVTFPLSYIGSDNIEGGRIVGDVLIKSMGGQGKVYIQATAPGTSSTDQRVLGCKEAIAATNGAVQLVGIDYNYHNLATSTAQAISVFQRVADLGGIFGSNLGSAEGIAQGIKTVNKFGAVKIASFDAPDQAITDLHNGIVDILLAQKPAEMGSIGVDYAINAINGDLGSIPKKHLTGFVIINRDNIDTPEAQSAIYVSK